jgi:hypothetical protein
VSAQADMQDFPSSTRVHGDLHQHAPIAISARREQAIDDADHSPQSGALGVTAATATMTAISEFRKKPERTSVGSTALCR